MIISVEIPRNLYNEWRKKIENKNFIPAGMQAIIPYLQIKNIKSFIEFLQSAFDAKIIAKTFNDDNELFYATIMLYDSTVFVQEADGQPNTTSLYYYVENVDATFIKAISAGSIAISEPQGFYHGDRNAVIQDAWGNTWFIATNFAELSDEEVADRLSNNDNSNSF